MRQSSQVMTGLSVRLAVGGISLLVLLGSTTYALTRPSNAGAAVHEPIHGVRCDQLLQPVVHLHAHLDVFVRGRPVTVPAHIGIPRDGSCLYWLHTHDSSGVIHIEAPAAAVDREFTLGDFLAVWGNGPGSSGTVAILNGRPYIGDPADIGLAAHELITLEVGPPEVQQPGFQFRTGL